MNKQEVQQMVVNQLGLKISQNGWARLKNPFDAKSRNPNDRSMAISFETGKVVCYRTGYNRTLKIFIKELGYGKDVIDSLENFPYKKYIKKEKINLPNEYRPLEYKCFFQERVLKYLEERKTDIDYLSSKGVGYCEGGRYSGRVIIPIYDIEYNFTGFTARSIIGSEPKYLMETSKSCFYNESAIDIEDDIYIVEGAFDAFVFYDRGVANLTKIISKHKLSKLINSCAKNVYLVPDRGAYHLYLTYAYYIKWLGHKNVFITDFEDTPYKDASEAGNENIVFTKL